MIEIKQIDDTLCITNSDKKTIQLSTSSSQATLDGLEVNFPGEYEKSEILLEVKQYKDKLFYNFTTEGKSIVYFYDENFEIKEKILSFFGDVDILVIRGSKESVKVFENIEARVVVPFGEGKDVFLNALGQHADPVNVYKIKAETSLDTTEFVNLQ